MLPGPVEPISSVLPPGSAIALRQLLPSIVPDGSISTAPFVARPKSVSRAPVATSKRSEIQSFVVPASRP